jgi:hypothetical protein
MADLGQAVQAQIGDLPIVRVRLYARDGTIVYSTEPEETGHYVTYGVVREMLSGHWYWSAGSPAMTELTHQEEFAALNGKRLDRDLVASLIPVPTDGRRLEALIEVTQDVTPEMLGVARAQVAGMSGAILISTALLGGSLYLINRRQAIARVDQPRMD